jgi:hypothetical protein
MEFIYLLTAASSHAFTEDLSQSNQSRRNKINLDFSRAARRSLFQLVYSFLNNNYKTNR